MKVNIRKIAFGFILFVILLLVGLLIYHTQVQAASGKGEQEFAQFRTEPYIVNLWWAYCVDHTTPFFVKPDSFPFSNPEYNYLEVSCMTMNANYQWKESWWRHCQGVSPQVRHRWVSPWSVLIGCFDEIGVK